MLTQKKRKFAEFQAQGLNQKESAIKAGYSQSHAKQTGCRLSKDRDVLDHMKRLQVHEQPPEPDSDDPRAFLRWMMSDPTQPADMRMGAAKALLADEKGSGSGKKAGAAEAADQAGKGRFRPGQSPLKLVKK